MPTIEHIAAAELDAAEPILRAYPFKPYYYYRASSEDARYAFFRRGLDQTLARQDAFILRAGDRGTVSAVIAGEMREFDSIAIGMKAAMLGPVVVTPEDPERRSSRMSMIEAGLAELKKRGAQHVTMRCEADDLELLHLLESTGFITVDSIIHLAWDLRSAPAPDPAVPDGLLIRDHRRDDIPKLRLIARSALRADRFHGDPAVNQETAHEAYARWVENACEGLDDAVAVAVMGEEPVGFMTAKIMPHTREILGTSVGKLWIGSLSPSVRGKGLYGSLAAYLINWLAARGVDVVEGGTQTRNIPALRSLTRRGFLPANSMTTLRTLL